MTKETKTPAFDPAGPTPEAIEGRLKILLPDLTVAELAQLRLFYAELQSANRIHAWIPSATMLVADSSLFFDSIRAVRLIYPELVKGHPVYDLGGASGFPGVVFGILYPTVPIQILERDRRKNEFFHKVIDVCGLENLTFVSGDLEQIPASSLFNAIFRANPVLTKSLISARKATAKSGKLFHIKGDSWSGEVASLPAQLFSFWQAKLIGHYKLPVDQTPVNIVMTQKLAD